MIQLLHRMPAAAPIRQRITRTVELPHRCCRGSCAVPAGSASPAGTAARAPHPPSWATSWATRRVHRRVHRRLHRRSSTPPSSARHPLRRPPARPRRPRPRTARQASRPRPRQTACLPLPREAPRACWQQAPPARARAQALWAPQQRLSPRAARLAASASLAADVFAPGMLAGN